MSAARYDKRDKHSGRNGIEGVHLFAIRCLVGSGILTKLPFLPKKRPDFVERTAWRVLELLKLWGRAIWRIEVSMHLEWLFGVCL